MLILFVSALGSTLHAQQLPKVAIIASDYYGAAGEQQLALDLEATGRFALVDFYNATFPVPAGTPPGIQPTLEEIMEYDAILLSTNSALIDAVALGNDLDVFAYAGGGIVLAGYVFDTSGVYNTFLQGTWKKNKNWDIVQYHELVFIMEDDCYTGISTIYEPDSPLVQGLETLTFAEYNTGFMENPPLVEGAVRVVDMEAGGGLPLIYRHNSLPNRIDIGSRAAIAESCTYDGIMSGGANLIANCLEYVSDLTTGISDIDARSTNPVLDQNRPNPFSHSTVISYSLPDSKSEKVTLKVFNLQGQEVATLVDAVQTGRNEVHFDATGLPAGMYFYTLLTGKSVQTRKFIIEK